jgi:hypothetical protein
MSTRDWVSINATIFSANYIDSGGEERPFWRVVYSFRVDDDYYSGEFTDFANDSEVEYHKDESLSIEYLAANPNKNRVPGATTYWSKARIPFAIGALLALAVALISALKGK